MYRLSRLRFIFPIGLFLALFLDGSLSNLWARLYFAYPYSMVSELVILWLVLSYFFEQDITIPLIPFAIAAGAVFDLYSSGILGLNIVLFPLIVELTKVLSRYFSPSFLTMIMIFFVDIVVLMTLTYWAYSLVGITSMGIGDFLLFSLTPTLALNLVYFVIFYWPVSALYQHVLNDQRV